MIGETLGGRRLLLVGWDAADLATIHPLVDSGRMPHLRRLMETGATGALSTFPPLFSPLLWTSVATGHRPETHGVLGFHEPATDGVHAQPVTRVARRRAPLWEMLAAHGRRTQVFAWPATHPAQALPGGVGVSDWFFDPARAGESSGDTWPVPTASVQPAAMGETFAELRLHPGELSVAQLSEFIPALGNEPALASDPRVMRLAHYVAQAASVGFAAGYALENEPWEFAAVYFGALEGICRDFMAFHPPQLPHVSGEDFERFQGVVRAAYALLDSALGGLLAHAGADAHVLVISTHGYHHALRPSPGPGEQVAGATVHRARGFAVLRGPGVRADALFDGADVLGVFPTVFALLGLPVPSGLPGRTWQQALVSTPPLAESAFAETETPRGLRDAVAMDGDPRAPDDAFPPVPGSPAELARIEWRYNLALCHLSAGRPVEALPPLEETHAAQPERAGPILHLVSALHAVGRHAESRAKLEMLAARPDGGLSRRGGQRPRFTPQFDLMRGVLDLAEGRPAEALRHLLRARRARVQGPELHRELGRVFLALRRPVAARAAFSRALRIDPDDAGSLHGRSLARYRLRRFAPAAEDALRAATLAPEGAGAHLLLGLSLARLGEDDRAIPALRHAVEREAGLALAHRVLARLLRRRPGTAAQAELHRLAARSLRATAARKSREGPVNA